MRKTAYLFILVFFLCPGSFSLAQDTLSLLFAGDIMQHRKQLESAFVPGGDTLKADSYSYSSYFRHIREHLSKADLAIVNLETTLEARPYTGYPCFSSPRTLVEEAFHTGFDIFLLANNHIADKGRRGMKSTLDFFRESGYGYTGLYADSLDYLINAPLLIEEKGIRIALINFSYGINGRTRVSSPYIVPLQYKKEVKALIAKAREEEADLIIAVPHWGQELHLNANANQKHWRDFLHEEGVRIIVGTHPHVLQEIETSSKNGQIEYLTAYSLGNLISGMTRQYTRTGKMLKIDLVRDSRGEIQITGYSEIWTWCSLAGRFERKYTILPIEEYLDRPEAFEDPDEYERMVQEYNELRKHYDRN